MAYGVCLPVSVAAMNVDAWNRSCVSASAVENGSVLVLATKSVTAGLSEVWTATVPGTVLTGLWMAYEPEIVLTTSGSSQYKGIDPDPRNFRNEIGSVFSAFKPQLGDIITLTGDALSTNTSYSAGVTTHVNAIQTTGGLKLEWASGVGTAILSLKLLVATNIAIATGAIDTQRVTAYQFEVVVL
jgi:hypothetical protein